MSNLAFSFSLFASRLTFRRELRFALLAAMETCWVYAVLVLFAALMNVPPFASPLMLFGVYWLAMILGRELPRRQEPWVTLQAAAIFVAVILILLVARVELYNEYGIFDFGWLTRFISALALTQGSSRAIYTTLAVVYMFIRGLGFGSRPLTLWFVGFQFRLGIVFFFLVFLGSAMFHPVEISRWIFVYFAVSLIAIALARMEEMGTDLRYGPRWAMILLGGVALVFFFGFGLLQVFTLGTTTAFLRLFSPLWLVVEALLLLIAIPAGLIVSFLVDWLRPLFANLSRLLQDLRLPNLENTRDQIEQIVQSNPVADFLIPLLKTAAILAVVLWIGARIARALNRRMQQADDALYERETLDSEDESTRAKRELGLKKKPARPRAGDLSAESIRRIYAALVARARDAGIPRREAETPYEFLPRIMREWQEQSSALRDITEAYVAVHYAEHQAAPHEVSRVRETWKHIEEKLKRSKVRTS